MKLGTIDALNGNGTADATEQTLGAEQYADNQNVWEKLNQLQEMFPAQDEDVLYEVNLNYHTLSTIK